MSDALARAVEYTVRKNVESHVRYEREMCGEDMSTASTSSESTQQVLVRRRGINWDDFNRKYDFSRWRREKLRRMRRRRGSVGGKSGS